VRLLTNSLVLRMAGVFFAAAMAFVLALIGIRQLRRSVQDDATLDESTRSAENFPLHTYHAVIQQLKQQKHELQAVQQAERRRAKASENISAAVLSNLSCGVLFFNNSGLVRQANPAAKDILGFASPAGMNATQLFRDATVRGGLNSEKTPLANAVETSLKTLSKFQRLEADYVAPDGHHRVLEVTILPVYDGSAEILGATCLINDQTELAHMRRTQQTGGQLPAELALHLKKSLETIVTSAKDLATSRDSSKAEQLASAISAEADYLQRIVASVPAIGTAAGAASGLD
jgi:PAS domain-containing protein